MRILRFEREDGPQVGVVRGDDIVALEPLSEALPTVFAISAGGPEALKRIEDFVSGAPAALALSEARLLIPIERPGKYLAIGMNYRKHVEEAARLGVPPPTRQYWFNKQTSCLSGPFDAIDPGVTKQLDYEVELGVVIGSRARYLAKAKAMDAVAGYCLANDVSERNFQIERSGGQWGKGKGCETFGSLGPWLVTKDEISNPQRLDMWLSVNGETRQHGSTRTMIFGVAHLVWYCSQFFVLEPGDVIITGTPPGVGLGIKPEPKFLKAGDVVRLGIDGLGEQQQKVVRFKM